IDFAVTSGYGVFSGNGFRLRFCSVCSTDVQSLSFPSAPPQGGPVVTLRGRCFCSFNYSLYFNGARLSANWISDSQLTFVLPPGIGNNIPVKVVGFGPEGTVGS